MSDELPTPDTSNRDTNTTSVGGNVTTGRDFVGRDLTVHGDQVEGDKVAGDKISADDRGVAAKQIVGSTLITGDNNTINYPRLDLTDARNQRNHATMRQLVRKFWIDGVLKSSLYNEVLLRLNLTEQPKAVDNRPWDLILQQPGKPNYEVPPGTPIIDVFDQMNGFLLILGEPGSGKTTMLLELADELLRRAESDPTHPTPVVFNLSSWAEKRQPLAEWLVDELRIKYNIPKTVAQEWIANDELLLLLDGLDEVQQENREDCVTAINQFRQEHLVPLVVCSRTTEYNDLTTQLRLQGAVLVQPLALNQIDEYLDTAGSELSAVRVALREDTELQEMATTPLLLSIMVIAYQGVSSSRLFSSDSTQTRQQYLFNTYIRRMFAHRGIPQGYIIPKVLHWLSWLATRLAQHGQTVFLIERMQPNWAHSTKSSRFTIAIAMLMWGPIYGMFFGLFGGLLYGLVSGLFIGLIDWIMIGWPNSELSFPLMQNVSYGSEVGTRLGLYWGFILGLVEGLGGRFKEIKLSQQSSVLRQKTRSALYSALFWVLFFWLSVKLGYGRHQQIIYIDGLFFGLAGGVVGGFREFELANPLTFSWSRLRFHLVNGILVGIVGGLLNGLLGGLTFGLVNGLIFGLLGGFLCALIFKPSAFVEVFNSLQMQTPNHSIRLSAKYTLMAVLPIGLLLGLLFGLIDVLIVSWLDGTLSSGVLAGLIVGLAGGVISGGDIVTKHCILRFILWWQGHIAWNYARFLDYCHDRLFLRKVGGGYIFIHRMLMEHFASLTDDDIKRLSADIEARK